MMSAFNDLNVYMIAISYCIYIAIFFNTVAVEQLVIARTSSLESWALELAAMILLSIMYAVISNVSYR